MSSNTEAIEIFNEMAIKIFDLFVPPIIAFVMIDNLEIVKEFFIFSI